VQLNPDNSLAEYVILQLSRPTVFVWKSGSEDYFHILDSTTVRLIKSIDISRKSPRKLFT